MALMLGRMFRAFVSSGVDEKDAREAAEELADIKVDVIKLDAKVSRIEWMLGTNVAISIAVLLKLLFT